MKKLSLLVLMLFTMVSMSLAQRSISGTVTDMKGEALISASVQVEGTTVGTLTDLDGSFTLQVPEGSTMLEVSYTGYQTQKVDISSGSTFTIKLEEGQLLDEVVVVGYGSQDKTNVSGSISSVDSERIQNKPVAGIDGALQGEVAGLQLTSNSGQPGAGMSVRIRGNSSINAGNEPLYVIDGIPVITGDFSENYYGGMDFNALSDINPSDIESIEVLKDAAAASIYGSRASNGVVLITTKRGSASAKSKIGFGYSYGQQKDIKRWDMLSGEQYSELNEIDWNGKNVDFMDAIYRTAPISQYDLSVQGGDLKTKYYIGGSFFDQEGTIIGQAFGRLSGRMNFDHAINDKLSLGASISMSSAKTNVVQSDNNIYGALSLAILQPQNVDLYNEDGSYNFQGMFFENPVATALEKKNEIRNVRTLGNINVKYNLLDNLSFNSKVGMDRLSFEERTYNPSTTAQGSGANGESFVNATGADRVIFQNNVDYQQKLIDGVNLGVLAGMDFERFDVKSSSLAGNGFPSPEFQYLASAAEYTDASQDLTANTLLSYYGRANFDLYNKYVVTATFRADGSSKFGKNKRYGYFPSVSVGWKVNNESFLSGVEQINDLKIRASYGITGNQAGISNFASRGLAGGGFNYNGQPGVSPTSLPNPDLKWEETAEMNIGLDFALFNNFVSGTFDLYNKKTNDLLLNRPLPASSGFAGIDQNVGEMTNKGWELGLNFTPVRGDFEWNLGLQIAKNVNEVVKLFEGQGFDAGFLNRIDEGQPLSYFYGWKSEEFVDPATGDVVYEDLNGDGKITAADNQFIGSPHPDYVGSINNTLSYKGFTLSAFFNFVQGNEVLNYTRVFNEDGLRRGFNNNVNVLNRWQNEGDVTTVPRFGGPNATLNNHGGRFVEDGSFLRFKNVTLSYDLDNSILDKAGLGNLRVYVAADNLMTWTKYQGLDPEANYAGTANLALGTDFLTQGLNRTIRFGVKGTF